MKRRRRRQVLIRMDEFGANEGIIVMAINYASIFPGHRQLSGVDDLRPPPDGDEKALVIAHLRNRT